MFSSHNIFKFALVAKCLARYSCNMKPPVASWWSIFCTIIRKKIDYLLICAPGGIHVLKALGHSVLIARKINGRKLLTPCPV